MKNLKKVYELMLMQKIRENGGSCEEPDQIWENLEYLTTEVQNFDEVKRYLPLQVKKILLFLMDPKHHKEFTVIRENGCISCECKIYWEGETTPAGIGFVKRYLSQIFPTQGMTSEERDSVIESSCRSLALSQAITDAGIGLQFNGEAFDSMMEKMEKEDFERLQERKNSAKVPDVPPTTKAIATAKKKEEKAQIPHVAAEPTPLPEPKKEEKILAEEKVETPVTPATLVEKPEEPTHTEGMSVEEARKQIADIGTYAGNDLGVLFDKAPKALIWLVNADSKVKDACMVLINSDEHLKGMLK